MKKEEINKLKTMQIEEVYSADEYFCQRNCVSYQGILIPGPVIDYLIPMNPWEVMDSVSTDSIDVIIGICMMKEVYFMK